VKWQYRSNKRNSISHEKEKKKKREREKKTVEKDEKQDMYGEGH
jgi:hypothetical protein